MAACRLEAVADRPAEGAWAANHRPACALVAPFGAGEAGIRSTNGFDAAPVAGHARILGAATPLLSGPDAPLAPLGKPHHFDATHRGRFGAAAAPARSLRCRNTSPL